jgi:hypothetical protein
MKISITHMSPRFFVGACLQAISPPADGQVRIACKQAPTADCSNPRNSQDPRHTARRHDP